MRGAAWGARVGWVLGAIREIGRISAARGDGPGRAREGGEQKARDLEDRVGGIGNGNEGEDEITGPSLEERARAELGIEALLRAFEAARVCDAAAPTAATSDGDDASKEDAMPDRIQWWCDEIERRGKRLGVDLRYPGD